jgi:predicted TIM-barrel fold metal-dependent hydrolase
MAFAVVMFGVGGPWAAVAAAEYAGPLIDAHSHLPNATAIEAYVAAMKRHNVTKVVLLGVGGVQKDDPAWITAAARKYPDRVVPGLPLPDPLSETGAAAVEAAMAKGGVRVIGEVHLRQVGRRTIGRDPRDPVFGRILDAAGRHKVSVVVHYELTDAAAAALDGALEAHRAATVVLAHAGEGPPPLVEWLLRRSPNLLVDLSGMHFQRKPALASETGPLEREWKALIEKFPDRFLMGIDVWAPRLFEPATLDRLMTWTRRVLGELRPEVAERVAYRNAAALFRLE